MFELLEYLTVKKAITAYLASGSARFREGASDDLRSAASFASPSFAAADDEASAPADGDTSGAAAEEVAASAEGDSTEAAG